MHAATSQFFDGLRASRLLDDARIAELEGRPEAAWGDVVSLTNYAQAQGWLTPYQARELREGRGDRLVVGEYRIFDQAADGPGGPTYKALHPALQEPVTLKVLRPDWLAPADSAPEYLARLRSASLVQSPHLATVLDAGNLDGSPYVVQELVDGCDLYQLVNEMGALPVGLACEYARQAALALRAAHEKGVVHGDVSPLTLQLTPVKRAIEPSGAVTVRPRPGARVKLAGLGLTPVRPAVGELTVAEEDKLGAVAFLAPERLIDPGRTPAADLFGLGASLYYLLTSRPPHAGDSTGAVLLSVQESEPAPVESLRSDVPPGVADLVRRLLSRDPASRPTAAEVADALPLHCEPSAAPPEAPAGDSIPLASGTDTQPGVPTAVPTLGSALLPEVQPLEDSQPSGETPFGSGTFRTQEPAPAKPRVQTAKKSLAWILAGVVLHLTAILLLVGYLTDWFAFLRPAPAPVTSGPEERRDAPPNRDQGTGPAAQ